MGSFSSPATSTPMRRTRSGCCARAASGHCRRPRKHRMRRLVSVPAAQLPMGQRTGAGRFCYPSLNALDLGQLSRGHKSAGVCFHRARYRSSGRVGAGSTTETASEAGNVSSSMHPLAFPSLLHRQHHVEPRAQHVFRAGDLHDEFGVEEIVRAVGLLVRKIELGGQHRPVGRLDFDVIMPGPAGI